MYEYVAETRRVGGLIVQVVADTSGASSPREFDNLSVIYGQHRNYTIGDGEPPTDEMAALDRGGVRLVARYVRRFKGAVAFCKLGMYDHSGVTFYAVPMGDNGHHAFDSAGWDSGCVGYAYITRARLDEMGSPIEKVDEYLAAEIEEYDDWAKGNVWGYVVTKPCDHARHEHETDEEIAACPHSEHVDSCWGFIGDDKYAMQEGVSVAESYATV